MVTRCDPCPAQAPGGATTISSTAPAGTRLAAPTPALTELSAARRGWILFVLCMAVLLFMFSFTVLYPAVVDMAADTGATQTEVTWIIDAFTLSMSIFLLPAGALGDRYGRRGLMNIGMAMFVIGSVLILFADTPGQLIAVRLFLGFAAALVLPTTLSLITSVFPPDKQPMAVAIWSAVMVASGGVGTICAGTVMEFWTWRAVLWMMLALAIVVAAMGWTVPTSRDESQQPLDVPGTITSALAIGGAVCGLIEGGNRGWTSTPVLVSFGVMVAATTVFILIQLRTRHPLLDVRVFKVRTFAAATTASVITFGAVYGVFYLGLQYMQYVQGKSPLEAGLVIGLIMVCGSIPASLVVPWVERRIGLRLTLTVCAFIQAGSFVLMTLADEQSSMFVIGLPIFTIGAGCGAIMAPAANAILGTVPADKAGVASAVNHTSREVGTALGVALLGSMLASGYTGDMREATAGLPEPARAASEKSIAGALAVAEQSGPAGPPLADAARAAFVHGMHGSYWVMSAVMAVTAIGLYFWIPRRADGPRVAVGHPVRAALRCVIRGEGGTPVRAVSVTIIDESGRQVGRHVGDGAFTTTLPQSPSFLIVANAPGHRPGVLRRAAEQNGDDAELLLEPDLVAPR